MSARRSIVRSVSLSMCRSSVSQTPISRRSGAQRFLRSVAIKRCSAFLEVRRGAETACERRLPHQARAQRVDGMDLQARRMRGELPAQARVLCQRGARELVRALLERAVARCSRRGHAQRLDYPLAHLGGRLAGEGHGDDALRAIHSRKQCEKALHEQSRFSRPGGRLDQKRASDVERGVARGAVLRGKGHRIHGSVTHRRPARNALRPRGHRCGRRRAGRNGGRSRRRAERQQHDPG